jgi:hypothetical protein
MIPAVTAPFTLTAVDSLLSRWQWLWQPAPFIDPCPVWSEQHPALTTALLALPDEQYQQLLRDDALRLHWLKTYLPELKQLDAFSNEGVISTAPSLPLNAAVKARKQGQVSAFVYHAADTVRGQRLIEWCAGQGWLLEGLAQRFPQQQLLGFEWQEKLCQQGNQRLQQEGLKARLHCADVLRDELTLAATDSVFALHACGHLHQALLQQVALQQPIELSLSPCCYHLGDNKPLSQSAQQAQLDGRLIDRHLAVQDTAVGHGNRQRHAEKNSQWRLGYELLRRHLSGDDQYRSAPSWPGHVLSGSFADFCRHSAEHHDLTLVDEIDFDHWQRQGEQLHRQVRRLELPRRQFRRLLEWWLVLDLASYLCEQGYQVDVGPFCHSTLTPRNLLIRANKY